MINFFQKFSFALGMLWCGVAYAAGEVITCQIWEPDGSTQAVYLGDQYPEKQFPKLNTLHPEGGYLVFENGPTGVAVSFRNGNGLTVNQAQATKKNFTHMSIIIAFSQLEENGAKKEFRLPISCNASGENVVIEKEVRYRCKGLDIGEEYKIVDKQNPEIDLNNGHPMRVSMYGDTLTISDKVHISNSTTIQKGTTTKMGYTIGEFGRNGQWQYSSTFCEQL